MFSLWYCDKILLILQNFQNSTFKFLLFKSRKTSLKNWYIFGWIFWVPTWFFQSCLAELLGSIFAKLNSAKLMIRHCVRNIENNLLIVLFKIQKYELFFVICNAFNCLSWGKKWFEQMGRLLWFSIFYVSIFYWSFQPSTWSSLF